MVAPERILEPRLARRTVAGYAIGSLGTGGFSTLPGLVLVYYLTNTLGVAPLVAGGLVTIAKIWDVLIDPVIGGRSDRSLAVSGSRRRLMMLGSVLLPVFFVLTFAAPAGIPPLAGAAWVLVSFILAATAFSLFQVPYIALPAELASGYDQRTRLLSVRVVVLTFAILLFGAGGPALRSLGGADARLGYLVMAVVAAVLIGVGLMVSSSVAPRGEQGPSQIGSADRTADTRKAVRLSQNYAASIRALRRSQPFRALLATFLLQGLATGLMLAAAQYVATYVLRSEGAVTFLFIALIAPALLFAPLWAVASRRIGKERGFAVSSSLFALAVLSMVLLIPFPGTWVYLSVALAGAGYAGMQALPLAMLPDVISHDARVSGNGQGGVFGGVWTAAETTGMALGTTVLALVLASTGFSSELAVQGLDQPNTATVGIVLAFSIVPFVLLAASLVTLRRYRLRRSDIDQ